MKKVLLVVAIALIGIAPMACKKDGKVAPMLWFGDEHNGKSIELVQGQELKISLTDANHDGYTFDKQPTYDSKVLEFIGYQHDAPSGPGSYPGGFGAESYVFKARKSGTSTVMITSMAPDKKTVDLFQSDVKIAGNN